MKDMFKRAHLGNFHPKVLGDLTVVSKPLMLIFIKSWYTGEVSEEWKKANVVAKKVKVRMK